MALADLAQVPAVIPRGGSVWAQYTIVAPDRDRVAAACMAADIPTGIDYLIPLNRQSGYAHFPTVPGGVAVSCSHLSRHVISLPMHPYLDS